MDSIYNPKLVKQTTKKINKEMKSLISKNEVIISTTDFGRYFIITTGGIIIADNLSKKIIDLAIRKRDNRRKKLNSLDNSYSKNHLDLYRKNKDIIKSLLDLQYCYWHETAKAEEYQQLLECLVGITKPSTQGKYEEVSKQLLKNIPIN